MSTASPDLRLHHVGFVAPDIAAAMKGFMVSLAATWDGRVHLEPLQKVNVAFLAAGPGDTLIEIVEPVSEDSPVMRFLRQKGGGLHHVCYETGDLEKQLSDMKSRGCLIARRGKPSVAFGGRRIAWVITPEKLLVELLERSLGDPENRRPAGG